MYKVLLVDDEPAILSMLKRGIKNHAKEFEVVGEAYDTATAIMLVKEQKPDVVLTDMKMPKESGIELIRYISLQEENKAVCVAVSGYSDFDYVHDSFAYGAFDYLLKPVEPKKLSELFSRIHELILSTEKRKQDRNIPQGKISPEQLLSEIDTYIRGHLWENNSIISICNRFLISQPYLSKIFKTYTKLTYNDYLIQIKVAEAKRLLGEREEYLIGQIAEMVGFSDQFYFSKVFKNATGYSPREYRKKAGTYE